VTIGAHSGRVVVVVELVLVVVVVG